MDLDKLIKAYGNVKLILTPSGFHVAIREQNGEDDDILSNVSLMDDGTAYNAFIAAIIVGCSEIPTLQGNLSEVLKLRPRDKYFILVSSRIFSLDNLVTFHYDWSDKVRVTYTEDLTNYIWDYTKDFPYDSSDPNYFKYRIKPYEVGGLEGMEPQTFALSTGKVISYTPLNGEAEKYFIKLPNSQLSINAELKARKLSLRTGNEVSVIENFRGFTATEMREIRTNIDRVDPRYDLLTDIENPETKEVVPMSLVGLPDFFYPRLI